MNGGCCAGRQRHSRNSRPPALPALSSTEPGRRVWEVIAGLTPAMTYSALGSVNSTLVMADSRNHRYTPAIHRHMTGVTISCDLGNRLSALSPALQCERQPTQRDGTARAETRCISGRCSTQTWGSHVGSVASLRIANQSRVRETAIACIREFAMAETLTPPEVSFWEIWPD